MKINFNELGAPKAKINGNLVHEVEILMTETETAYLQNLIAAAPEDATFVEYGCGGSTCFFATTLGPRHELHSIEHNKKWYERIRVVLSDIPVQGSISLYHKPAFDGKKASLLINGENRVITEEDLRPLSWPHEELPVGLEAYIHGKDTNIRWPSVHCVFVDGIARGAVLSVLRQKLTAGAIVILHDAKKRLPWYRWAIDLYDVVELVDHMLVLRVPAD